MDWDYILMATVRLAVAASLGGLIGLEREHHGRSAGLRTHLLVALGSALAMLVSLAFADAFGKGEAGPAVHVDPARVAYGVMTGIGFLGAGAILRYGAGIRGLTTAASLWCTASVGLAAGFGLFPIALIATGLVLFALYVLHFLDRAIPTRQYKKISIKLPAAAGDTNIDRVRKLLTDRRVSVRSVDFSRNAQTQTENITFHVAILPRRQGDSVLTIADELPDLIRISIN